MSTHEHAAAHAHPMDTFIVRALRSERVGPKTLATMSRMDAAVREWRARKALNTERRTA